MTAISTPLPNPACAHTCALYGPAEEKADQPPARPRTVAAVEKKLGVRLPPSYKKLVTTVGPYDGGYEVWWLEDPVGPGADIVAANRTRLAPFLIAVVPVLNGDSFCFDTAAPTNAVSTRSSGTITRSMARRASTSRPWRATWCVPAGVVAGRRASRSRGERARRGADGPGLRGSGTGAGSARVRLRMERVVETISAALVALRAAPAPRGRPGTELSPLGTAVQDNDLPKASELLARWSGSERRIAVQDPPGTGAVPQEPRDDRAAHRTRRRPAGAAEPGCSLLQNTFERDPELGKWLFQRLPDPTVVDAAEAGTLDDLRRLVDAGGDVNMASQDRRRFSPLQAAALRGDLEMATFLLERGADLNYRGAWNRPAVVIAATRAYSARMTELLLRYGADPNATDGRGHTPLYDVAASYWFDVLETLIRAGADVNFRAPDGSTPLHQAAGRNSDAQARAIHILVQHGAKLDVQDDQGFTPLHAALELHHGRCGPDASRPGRRSDDPRS